MFRSDALRKLSLRIVALIVPRRCRKQTFIRTVTTATLEELLCSRDNWGKILWLTSALESLNETGAEIQKRGQPQVVRGLSFAELDYHQ